MNLKTLFKWIYTSVSNYNLFMLEENDYNDEERSEDPAIVLKQQKCKTWLYIVLLTVCLYVLFYGTLIKIESETVIISNVTPDVFYKLYSEHGQTLSCPCSTITIPYKNFVSNNVTIHPVCSSAFVSKEWIQRLYFANASRYGIWDFRKVAYSQFELLSRLCLLSQEIISQIQADVDNTEFVTINLLPKMQIQLEIDNTIEFQKNNALGRMISFLNYWRTTIEENYVVSALGTNWIITTWFSGNIPFAPIAFQTQYLDENENIVSCGYNNPRIAALLPPLSDDSRDPTLLLAAEPIPNSTVVKGFFIKCTPLEALFESTLDCLYESECLQLFFDYFPNLNKTNFNWNHSLVSSKHDNNSVINYFQNLFIENWSSNMNYSTYFDQCSSSICTYTTTGHTNLSYGITLFISLYGGLIIILRLIASYLIHVLFKCKDRSNNFNENPGHQNTNMFELIQSVKQLNLFKNINNRTESSIKQQRIITRVYLILLLGFICIICLFTSLNSEVVTITVPYPSLTTYRSLEMSYSTTLQCPCSNKTIPYRRFLSFSPVFHPICSSGFIHYDWIYLMEQSRNNEISYDWRNKAYIQFQLLADLCQLAKKTIDAVMERSLSQFFIASSITNEIDFNQQLYTFLDHIYQSTVYNFDLTKDIVQLTLQVNQFHVGIPKIWTIYGDPGLLINIIRNKTNHYQGAQMQFILNGISDINSALITCICAANPYCQRSAVVSDQDSIYDSNNASDYNHNIVGFIQGCLISDSLLFSTFQCLYADSDCFPFLMSYLGTSVIGSRSLMSSSHIQPLVYDPTKNRYPPNTSISFIIKELMLEKWNPSSSYRQFYESCAPKYCSYSEIRHNYASRLKINIQNLIKLLQVTLVQLNIFTSRDFGSDVDQVTAKRYGRWATHLYMVLFLSSLTILIFYTIIRPHISTRNFSRPPLHYYKHLRETYGDELKCPCSTIASTYNKFVKIESIFHSICSSQFVLDKWRVSLTNGLAPNLTIYGQRDYRRFLSAHLQYLQGLCRFSIQSVNNSINELLTSLLVTSELLSENIFHNRLNIFIEQSKSNAPVLFSHLLFFTQSIVHGNAFLSTYGTNFEYIIIANGYFQTHTPTEAIIYDNNCSCGLSPNCTTEAIFNETNSSSRISIKGMKMGCTPSESLLASSLECFYDQSCLDRIQNYTNARNSSIPLSTISERFLQNTTIDELTHHLFVEKWSTQMNYSSYYEQCLPLSCSYTTVEKFNFLYIITIIFGLHGGLSIVLQWICPNLVRISLNIYHYRKKRMNSIHPNGSFHISSIMTTNTPNQHTTWNRAESPMNITIQTNAMLVSRSFLKIIFGIFEQAFIMVSNYELVSSESLQRQELSSQKPKISPWNTFKHHIPHMIIICLIDIVIPLLIYFVLENRIKPVYALLAASSPPFFMVIVKIIWVRSFDAIGFVMFIAFITSAVLALVLKSPKILLLEKSLLTGVGAVVFAITLIPFHYCCNRCQLRPIVYYFYPDLIPITRAEFGLPDVIFDNNGYIELKDDKKKEILSNMKEAAQVYAWIYDHCSSFRISCYFMTCVWITAFSIEFIFRIIFISLNLSVNSIFIYGQIVFGIVVAGCAILQVCTMMIERKYTLAYIEQWKIENLIVEQLHPYSLSTNTQITTEQ
ncbi:hypothetical protein I4U23_004508 [Adineta vaga]|nr:hypothetical protein I4U23_004508 [Adineta vaga]